MMIDSVARFFSSQILFQAPILLVYLVAFVWALIYIRHAALPSTLTIFAVIILGSTSIGFTLIQAYLIETQQTAMLNTVGILATGLRTVGTALLVAAIFAGRNEPISASVLVPKRNNS